MLSGIHREYYQQFQQALEGLQTKIIQANPDARSLQSTFFSVQQQFQQQIVSLNLDGIDASDFSRVQSLQTEINKQLRLLGVDVMFLQTARQSLTVQQRQAQMRDRIQLLLRYCEAILSNKA